MAIFSELGTHSARKWVSPKGSYPRVAEATPRPAALGRGASPQSDPSQITRRLPSSLRIASRTRPTTARCTWGSIFGGSLKRLKERRLLGCPA